MTGIIEQVSISRGGIPKTAVPEAWIGATGLDGDGHRNPKYHGGPLKAVLLLSADVLDELRAEGFDVSPGSLGENLTIRGLDFGQLRTGMRFRAGGAIVRLTSLRQPCATLDIFNSPGLRIQNRLYDALAKSGDPASPNWAKGGFYASVEAPGFVRPDDILELADLPC
ncbi:MAG: MOSC domain-containing protein [Bryobacteraceae bacterium]|nr:MOSC domain-containing protein [Bryobacteraceae bacterium]